MRASTLRAFVTRYGRRAQKGTEPNDRSYDREMERQIRRMDPIALDGLLRDDEGG